MWQHSKRDMPMNYVLACIWEGQEGSFLLWSIWHGILGSILIFKSKDWEAPVMTIINFAQCFIMIMILGIYVFDIRIGSSPFVLTRNELEGPIFSQPDYLSFIKDGVGLNVLLRNYWMVIHPPILFLGFASTIVPFAFAYASSRTDVNVQDASIPDFPPPITKRLFSNFLLTKSTAADPIGVSW